MQTKSNGKWVFERCSGYAGQRCTKCLEWIYCNDPLICKCDNHEELSLLQPIEEYKTAQSILKAATSGLNTVVEPLLKKLVEDKDLDGLRELVESLPLQYRGCWRIYYAMEKLGEELNK